VGGTSALRESSETYSGESANENEALRPKNMLVWHETVVIPEV
jgi:hypothetical protein